MWRSMYDVEEHVVSTMWILMHPRMLLNHTDPDFGKASAGWLRKVKLVQVGCERES
jgi:hypothetical protein